MSPPATEDCSALTTHDGQESVAQSPPAYTEAWLSGPDGLNFYTRTYSAPDTPRAVVLFVHGFAEYIALHEWAHAQYAARGITLFAYDQRGFGWTALDSGLQAHKGKRSDGSKYCKTTRREQLQDMAWWLEHVRKMCPGLPVFLVGPSMGGALALEYVTRHSDPGLAVAGVIASSPFLLQTEPAPWIARIAVRMMSVLLPFVLFSLPADQKAMTHDDAVNKALSRDPFCPKQGSFKAIQDMLSGGENLMRRGHQAWPRDMPLLIVHGTADKVASCKAARQFFDNIEGQDKTFIPIEGAFHELEHESDGVKEKLVEDCIAWILRRSTFK